MRGSFVAAALVCGLSVGLVACEGAARGGCASPEDVAVKMTALTDALNKAQTAGKIDMATAGQIAGRIMEAGTKHGDNHGAYCGALEKIRADAKL